MKEFKQLVRRVMETLPDEFRPFLDNVVVEVEEWPDDDLLRRAGFTEEEIEDGERLLGFFDPFELPTAVVGDTVDHPHKLLALDLQRAARGGVPRPEAAADRDPQDRDPRAGPPLRLDRPGSGAVR